MADTRYDALCIGNAIVDVISRTEEDFLIKEGLSKGAMHLIDSDRAESLYDAMGPAIEASGGCAGNTAAGIASLGGAAAFIGKVADDTLGKIYAHDMRAIGVHFDTPKLVGGAPTARSMIFITPDGERTMNTYLGACQELGPDDIDPDLVASAAVTYLEGYLWDPPLAKQAFRRAAEIAHEAERLVALTLSDSFCVDRFREEFLDLMRSNTVDIIFANDSEIRSLYQTSSLDEAVKALAEDCPLSAVTLGEDGAMAVTRDGGYQGLRSTGRECRRSDRRGRSLCLRFSVRPGKRHGDRGRHPSWYSDSGRSDRSCRTKASEIAERRRPGGRFRDLTALRANSARKTMWTKKNAGPRAGAIEFREHQNGQLVCVGCCCAA